MTLEADKRTICQTVVDDISSYQAMLSKWRRLGLEKFEFFLTIAKIDKKRYARRVNVRRSRTITITMPQGDLDNYMKQLADAKKELLSDGYTKDQIRMSNIRDYGYNAPARTIITASANDKKEEDKKFVSRIRKSLANRYRTIAKKDEAKIAEAKKLKDAELKKKVDKKKRIEKKLLEAVIEKKPSEEIDALMVELEKASDDIREEC